MSNIGGLEIIMVLLVALIVLGPTKLPDAARQLGKAVTELRRISGGFQRELREAIQDPIIEAEARARGAVESAKKQAVEPFTSSPTSREPTESATTDDRTTDGDGSDNATSDGETPADSSTDDDPAADDD
jgi:sec-independent protein translocase protein TatB